MNAAAKTELSAVAATEAGALALPTLNPEAYAAAIYAPFHAKLDAAIAEADAEPMPDCSTTAGMALAVKRRAFFRDDVRIAVEDARTERKAPILEIGRKIDGKAAEIKTKAAPYESRYHEAIKAEESRKEAEKAAKIAAERARTEAIADAMDGIREREMDVVRKTKTAEDALAEIDCLAALEITESTYQERFAEAQELKASTLEAMRAIHASRVESEAAALAAEQSRIAEAARLEAEKVELARQRAENERIANEQAAERQRLADLAEAQALAAQQLADKAANLKAERDAQALAMQIERDKAAREQAAANAEIQAAQDALNAKVAAHDAAVRMEADHAEALIENAERDEMRAAMLARCTETAQAMLTNGRSLIAESVEAYADAGLAEDDPVIDYEAIAWAYKKLLAFGVGNGSMDGAMMLDRLNLMLLSAPEVA